MDSEVEQKISNLRIRMWEEINRIVIRTERKLEEIQENEEKMF